MELTCDMTLPGLSSFLAYNLVLVLLCSVFAFKTCKLPDNFIERSSQLSSEKLIGLNCDMTLPGLSSFLAYNFVLVLLCSVFAFKTRKIPDNFIE
ncbi:metabotropic glutamate receptor-like [Plakobranchus ocellatus]|uniref:Metabotropic glutamate receptor-like n=1 Tax=Plakobranchus ocellatus TaxID=259542 RepID=A0AAV4D0X8_9GAST|nr:metabotropic glutamate receptor-like [Plakobranchus ocellatus]